MSDTDRNKENVVTATKRPTRKQEDLSNVIEAVKPGTRSQSKGGRKRKQDNPKPTKPRVYVVPIAQKGKKPVRERKGKAKGRVRKLEPTNDDTPVEEAEVTAEQSKPDKDTESSSGKADGSEAFTIYIDNPVDNEFKDVIVNTNAKPSENPDNDDHTAISKPFKKRGRSRKPICDFSKVNSVQNADKKVTTDVTKSKRARKKTDTDEQTKPNTNTDKQANQLSYNDPPLPEDPNTSCNDEDQPNTNKSDADKEDAGATALRSKRQQTAGRQDQTHISDSDTDKEDKKASPNAKRQRTTGRQDQTRICETCGLGVARSKYVYHVRGHTGERPYVCERCGKSFARARFLTKHLVTHSEVKPWKCDICPAQFCQKNEYNMHMRGHKGDRPYQCTICDVRFLSKTSLHTHQANIHMGLTRFECDICKRRFFKHSSLTCHRATHYEATLKCSFCDRKFRDKTGLKRHEKIHTGVKKFKCHICEHAFIQSTPYWTHMEKRHALSKVKVKEMLKSVKEKNHRSGISMDINVLPADVDIKALVKHDTEDEKLVKRKAMEELKEGFAVKPLPKFHQLTRPCNSAISDVEDVFSEQMDTTMMLRHYIPITTLSQGGILGLSLNSSAVSSLPGSGGVTTVLQPSVPVSVPALQIHGLIGINTLQQTQDITSNLPQAGSYTDISRDRVVAEAEPQ